MPIFRNKDEFKQLFTRWFNPLCNYAYTIIPNRVQVKDVVQDVFMHMWEKRESLHVDGDLKSYLFKSTYYKCIEKIRQHKAQQRLVAAKKSDDLYHETSLNFLDISENYLLKERINNSVRQLPPKCQEVFLLSRKNGLTYEEIANSLGISKKTVENHVMKALDFLRKNLKK